MGNEKTLCYFAGCSLLSVLYLVNYSLECCWVVHSKICKNFAVDFDTSLVDKTHQL